MTIHERPPASATALRALIDAPTRAAIEAHVQDMIDFLDKLDGDCDAEPDLAGFSGAGDDREGDTSDLEESGDEHEPSLGSLGGTWNADRAHQGRWAQGSRTDAEGPGDEDDEDGGDAEPDNPDEPSLGSLDQPNQERWADHADVCTWNVTDGELDDSDLEDTGDDEPTGDEMDGDIRSEDDPIFPLLHRDLAAETVATAAETRRLSAILARLRCEGVQA